jgi:hypothetical protein
MNQYTGLPTRSQRSNEPSSGRQRAAVAHFWICKHSNSKTSQCYRDFDLIAGAAPQIAFSAKHAALCMSDVCQ